MIVKVSKLRSKIVWESRCGRRRGRPFIWTEDKVPMFRHFGRVPRNPSEGEPAVLLPDELAQFSHAV